MPRLPLCLLLSLGLHIACGGLLRESFAQAGEAHAEALPLVVQLVSLEAAPSPAVAPLSATPVAHQAPAEPAAEPEPLVQVASTQAKTLALKKPSAPLKPSPQLTHAAPRPVPIAAPAASAQPAATNLSAKAAPAVAVAVPSAAKQEILSFKPAFHAPPAPPRYPAQARRRNQQGVVMIEVRLDEHGTQRELKLLRSSGVDSLDQAALDAVAVWRFQAEVRDGQKVPSRVQIPIQFALTANR
jgi:protein TonB